jgi:hypothetical protein
MVTNYNLHLKGVLNIRTRSGEHTIAVRQTTLTTIKDVGRTSFEVPVEARTKLSR